MNAKSEDKVMIVESSRFLREAMVVQSSSKGMKRRKSSRKFRPNGRSDE
jgi:hypothetical protein